MPAALGKAGGAQLLAVQEQGVLLPGGCISPLAGWVGLQAHLVPKPQAAACSANSLVRLNTCRSVGLFQLACVYLSCAEGHGHVTSQARPCCRQLASPRIGCCCNKCSCACKSLWLKDRAYSVGGSPVGCWVGLRASRKGSRMKLLRATGSGMAAAVTTQCQLPLGSVSCNRQDQVKLLHHSRITASLQADRGSYCRFLHVWLLRMASLSSIAMDLWPELIRGHNASTLHALCGSTARLTLSSTSKESIS